MKKFPSLDGFPAVIGTSCATGTGGYSLLTANFTGVSSAVRLNDKNMARRVHNTIHTGHDSRAYNPKRHGDNFTKANLESFVSRGIGERVLKVSLIDPQYEIFQEERMRTVTRAVEVKRLFGKSRQEEVTEEITEQVPVRKQVGETPVTMGSISGSSDTRPATVIGYSFLGQTNSLAHILTDFGGRPGNSLAIASVVPAEISDEIFVNLQEDPGSSRDMARYIITDIIGLESEVKYPNYDKYDDLLTHIQFATDSTQGPDEGLVLPV